MRGGEVLVAIMNDQRDFQIAREKHWYRIPIASVYKFLNHRWPPQWIAFYQTKIFGAEKYSIRYFGKVISIKKVTRKDLFPNESTGSKSDKIYYQVIFEPLQKRGKPILSRRWRRIIFIPTTLQKFLTAVEINDLFDDSPLEDKLWAELKRLEIAAERQFRVQISNKNYFLDFAIECEIGNLGIETDGDTYHTKIEDTTKDNRKHNDLGTADWRVLRFNTKQINEEMDVYCIPKIVKNINSLGGVLRPGSVSRLVDLDQGNNFYQPSLFD